MNNKKLLISFALVLIALACGSGPTTVPVERLAPVIERLATLTPTGVAVVRTPAPPKPPTLAAVDTVPAATQSPPTLTLTPIPATDTPAPESTSTEIPATEVPPPTVAAEVPTPVPATPVPATVAPAATAAADCVCSANTYNCDDARAQTCFNYCLSAGAGDVHDLDRDHDGLACENN